jgi:hypothetical protein
MEYGLLLSSQRVTGGILPKRALLPIAYRDEKANPTQEKIIPVNACEKRPG